MPPAMETEKEMNKIKSLAEEEMDAHKHWAKNKVPKIKVPDIKKVTSKIKGKFKRGEK